MTFHLADSLPGRKLAAFREQKKRGLTLNAPPHNQHQIEEFRRNFTERIDRWLDAGHGSCILVNPQIHQVVKNALTFFDGERYSLGEHVIMPQM